ncbi:MAG: nuclear transport factor 2 family protein [Gammaproteobacteria bacterium]|nr:nuclear transport factor 2 family protein [Gammaproteobacteria bacterium]
MDCHAALARYAELFETVSPDVLDRLDDYFAADARFKDPFNDVRGLERIRHVFQRMFETCLDISFSVHERFLEGHGDGNTACLTWTMTFRPDVAGQRGKTWEIHGASRITFDASGRVTEHIDYWDSGEYFYAKLPFIGAIIRAVRRRVG